MKFTDYKNFDDMLDTLWYKKDRAEIIIETEYAIGIYHHIFNSCYKIYIKVPDGLIDYKYYLHTFDSEEEQKILEEIKKIIFSIGKDERNTIYNDYLNRQIKREQEDNEKRIQKINNLEKKIKESQKFIEELENHML